jgi:hypothetical protein
MAYQSLEDGSGAAAIGVIRRTMPSGNERVHAVE